MGRMNRYRSLVPAAVAAALALAWCAGASALTVKDSPRDANEAVAGGASLSATATLAIRADGIEVTRLVVRDAKTRATRAVRVVRGAWALPRPVLGGRVEGLSWDGSVAVLRSLARPSRLAVVALEGNTPARIVDLSSQGTFEFDALSVSGTSLFLSEYASAKARVLDRIRVYDTLTGKLQAQPVIDKLEGAESMAGVPVARVYSPDGATVYTVYDANRHPFVHVLLTGDAISLCLDLPARGNAAAPGAWRLTLDSTKGTVRAASSRLGKAFVIRVRDSIGTIVRVENLTRST